MRRIIAHTIATLGIVLSQTALAGDHPGLHASEIRGLQAASHAVLTTRANHQIPESAKRLREDIIAMKKDIMAIHAATTDFPAPAGVLRILGNSDADVSTPVPVQASQIASLHETRVRQALSNMRRHGHAVTAVINRQPERRPGVIRQRAVDSVLALADAIEAALNLPRTEKIAALHRLSVQLTMTPLIDAGTTNDQPTFQTNLRHRR